MEDSSSSCEDDALIDDRKNSFIRDEDISYQPIIRPLSDTIGDDYKILDLIESTNEYKSYFGIHQRQKFFVLIKFYYKSPTLLRKANIETEALTITNTIDLTHQYFVKYIGRYEYNLCPILIFQALGPTLTKQMEFFNGLTFSLSTIRVFMWHLIHALELLHECKLICGNLSTDTVSLLEDYVDQKGYVMKTGERSVQLRINSLSCASNGNIWHVTSLTPERIQSPEQLLSTRWSYEIDIWQLGILFVELITGRKLFTHNNRLLHYALIEKLGGQFPLFLLDESQKSEIPIFRDGKCDISMLDDECRKIYNTFPTLENLIHNDKALSFAQATLCTDPSRRLLPLQLINHPFIIDLN